MSKYRITVENIGEGADFAGAPVECDGFVIAADQGDKIEQVLYEVNPIDIARMIAGSDDLRGAARIALAIHEAMREKRSALPAFATLIEALRGKD